MGGKPKLEAKLAPATSRSKARKRSWGSYRRYWITSTPGLISSPRKGRTNRVGGWEGDGGSGRQVWLPKGSSSFPYNWLSPSFKDSRANMTITFSEPLPRLIPSFWQSRPITESTDFSETPRLLAIIEVEWPFPMEAEYVQFGHRQKIRRRPGQGPTIRTVMNQSSQRFIKDK